MSLRGEVVVASNRAAAGVYADETGPLIVAFLTELGFTVPDPVVVPPPWEGGDGNAVNQKPRRSEKKPVSASTISCW